MKAKRADIRLLRPPWWDELCASNDQDLDDSGSITKTIINQDEDLPKKDVINKCISFSTSQGNSTFSCKLK